MLGQLGSLVLLILLLLLQAGLVLVACRGSTRKGLCSIRHCRIAPVEDMHPGPWQPTAPILHCSCCCCCCREWCYWGVAVGLRAQLHLLLRVLLLQVLLLWVLLLLRVLACMPLALGISVGVAESHQA